MMKFPCPSTVTALGSLRQAEVASAPSPVKPQSPLPATVRIVPVLTSVGIINPRRLVQVPDNRVAHFSGPHETGPGALNIFRAIPEIQRLHDRLLNSLC